MTLERVRLPGTDLDIARIGIGCEPLGGVDWGPVDERSAIAAIRKAWASGVNLFDTADVYGLGKSEEVLSRALGPHRRDAVIVSKFGLDWRCRPGARAAIFRDSSPRRVREALEGSLRRLRLDCIPLYLIHWPDPEVPIEDTIEALLRCRAQGKIRHLGVSNFSAALIRKAHRLHPLGAVELHYNLLERACERAILPLCRELGIGVLAYGPLAQGFLTGKYGPAARFGGGDRRARLPHFAPEKLKVNARYLERLETLAASYRKTVSQVALRWVLDHRAVACAIAGVKARAHAKANIGALGWELAREDRDWAASGGGEGRLRPRSRRA
ncbi:MAG: aldo/keto reductase [Elusimicrobia bacterium]|nr:aldo/keto reductase [Elusimicrobiota bacterium]